MLRAADRIGVRQRYRLRRCIVPVRLLAKSDARAQAPTTRPVDARRIVRYMSCGSGDPLHAPRVTRTRAAFGERNSRSRDARRVSRVYRHVRGECARVALYAFYVRGV